jgi:hypothetical protein
MQLGEHTFYAMTEVEFVTLLAARIKAHEQQLAGLIMEDSELSALRAVLDPTGQATEHFQQETARITAHTRELRTRIDALRALAGTDSEEVKVE